MLFRSGQGLVGGGIIATDDTDAQLKLLQRTLPLRVRLLPWLTVIERDDSPRQ